MFNRLIYLQAADEVIIGNIPVADENVIMRLVAGSVDLADEFPDQAMICWAECTGILLYRGEPSMGSRSGPTNFCIA